MRTLVLGGVRSGKSRLAARLARESGQPVAWVATAQPKDREMRDRIAAHRAVRPADWSVVEEPITLARAIAHLDRQGFIIVVDCLTLWLTNLLLEGRVTLDRERKALMRGMSAWASDLILISNETNLGIVPRGKLSRRFCDEAGFLHQELAACCERVLFCVAGIPVSVKEVEP